MERINLGLMDTFSSIPLPHVDISVVNPTVKDYLKLAQQPLGAAHARELLKDGIYKEALYFFLLFSRLLVE